MKKSNKALIISLVIFLVLTVSLLFLLFESAFYSKVSDKFTFTGHTSPEVMLVAHRGFSGIAPQNTLPAFEEAINYGFDGCELDIHTTKDGKWVVIHDDTVDAMTDGEGKVEEMTLKEIQKLNIDSGNGLSNYDTLKVPTLKEVLKLLSENNIIPVIEIKKCNVKHLPDLKKLIKKYSLEKKAVIISFEREYLEKYRELDPDAQILLLDQKVTEENVDWCKKNKVNGINFNHKNLTKSLKGISYAKKCKLKIGAWTVDNTIFKDIMVLFGADIITTNKIYRKDKN